MISVNVRTSMVLSKILGNWKFQIPLPDGSRFGRLLEILRKDHEDLAPYLFDTDRKTLAPHIMFMVNGRNIKFLNNELTILEDGDQVTILLPAGGG